MKLSDIRYKENGIPYVSGGQLDDLGESIVREIQPSHFAGQIDATDLKPLLSYLGDWHFKGAFLSKSGMLLGAACFQGGEIFTTDIARIQEGTMPVARHTILVDKALYDPDMENVFRFTFAHECGHALLHGRFCSSPENMKVYASQEKGYVIRDTKENVSSKDGYRLHTERDWLEWQANAFASAVLLPKSLVLETARIIKRGCSSDVEYYTQCHLTLSDVFKVSRTAAFYRMKGLGILPATARLMPGGVIVAD